MRRTIILASILTVAAVGMGLPGMAHAQNVSIGVQTNNMQLGINLGPTPPPMVAVPAPVVVAPGVPVPPPVYYAPNLPYHYLYHEGRWFRGHHYNGPWTAIAIAQVPRPILAVPVQHYHNRPSHWEHHGPPPWAQERERERHEDHGHGHGHGHDKDRG
jgi:hypothetical protein